MKDMTQGSPVKLIVGFAIPMLIGNVFQQVYNVVDTVIVGRFLGEDALAGVGSTGTLSGFLLALVMGLCNGAGLVVAQAFGSREWERLQRTVAALVWVAAGLTGAVSVCGAVGARMFLKLLSVPENVLDYSVTYLRITFVFLIFSVVYNGAAAILRSTGDSRTPLWALAASSLVNVMLDLFFIVKCGLGVAGAAYATVLSQMAAAIVTVAFLIRKREEIGLRDMKWKPEGESILLILRTGCPSALQSCMISLGGMSVQRLINSFGSAVMAAYTAANRVDSLAIQVIVSIGTALSVFTGQNIGGNRYERIREGLYRTLAAMVAASALTAGTVFCLRYRLMAFFLGSAASREAMEVGAAYLSIIGFAYVIAGVMQSYQNVIRGAGDVNVCMAAGLTELAGRIVFAYLLSLPLGIAGVWAATPISWGCGCVIPVIRYYSGRWKKKRLV